jgi:membrane protein implicated in regulation of membrane protease activity
MESPEFWRWVWLVAAVVFALGEMSTAGSFFLLPFALGALLAAILAFLGVDVAIEWLAFVAISGGSFAALRPLAKRLDRDEPTAGIGSRRLIGEQGVVLEDIPGGRHELGLARIGREEWRAESVDERPIPAGSRVRVVDVSGTRVVVNPVEAPSATLPPADHKEQ